MWSKEEKSYLMLAAGVGEFFFTGQGKDRTRFDTARGGQFETVSSRTAQFPSQRIRRRLKQAPSSAGYLSFALFSCEQLGYSRLDEEVIFPGGYKIPDVFHTAL